MSQSGSLSLQKWTSIHLEEMRDRFEAPKSALYTVQDSRG